MTDLRKLSGAGTPYWTICREERNLAAILYHLLLCGENLQRFLDVVGYQAPLSSTESAVYFEYAHLRDLWSSLGGTIKGKPDAGEANERKRKAIIELLGPSAGDQLTSCTVEEFNAYFGAVPKPSTWCIQSPSVWSLPLYVGSFPDPAELLRVTKFKWSFNAKPDIVVHTDADHALCIEAKLESGEGSYPTSAAEKTIFAQRGLPRVSQTELQEYLMSELLGVETEFLFLLPKVTTHATNHRMVTWATAFEALDLEGQPSFLRDWVRGHVHAQSPEAQCGAPKSRVTLDFRARVAELEHGFAAGYTFLVALADNRIDDFRLGTARNAHLYYQGDFYAYLKPDESAIEMHSTFNGRIWDGATDKHQLLFGMPLDGLLSSLGGLEAGWTETLSDGVILRDGTPPEFFDRLLDLIGHVRP